MRLTGSTRRPGENRRRRCCCCCRGRIRFHGLPLTIFVPSLPSFASGVSVWESIPFWVLFFFFFFGCVCVFRFLFLLQPTDGLVGEGGPFPNRFSLAYKYLEVAFITWVIREPCALNHTDPTLNPLLSLPPLKKSLLLRALKHSPGLPVRHPRLHDRCQRYAAA